MNSARPKPSRLEEASAQNLALSGPSGICSNRGVLATFED